VSPAFQEYAEARLAFAGLAAWSARFPDATAAHGCAVNWLSQDQVEQALGRLTVAAESMSSHQLEVVRACWVFQHLRVYVVRRPDGTSLALFVNNRHDLPQALIDGALNEFAALPFD
jgi:hypothetical protein